MLGLEDTRSLPAQTYTFPERGTQTLLLKFCSRALLGDMQPLLHWSTFEATYRRIGYAFPHLKKQSGGCCKPAREIPATVAN